MRDLESDTTCEEHRLGEGKGITRKRSTGLSTEECFEFKKVIGYKFCSCPHYSSVSGTYTLVPHLLARA
jgi:hypothetical protein